jgi:hypothetical protein
VKTLSAEEAKDDFKPVCEAAQAGETIRLQLSDGAFLELKRALEGSEGISPEQITETYQDTKWAAFENGCGAASA